MLHTSRDLAERMCFMALHSNNNSQDQTYFPSHQLVDLPFYTHVTISISPAADGTQYGCFSTTSSSDEFKIPYNHLMVGEGILLKAHIDKFTVEDIRGESHEV